MARARVRGLLSTHSTCQPLDLDHLGPSRSHAADGGPAVDPELNLQSLLIVSAVIYPDLCTEFPLLTVKILGSGCANCKKLEAVARSAAIAAKVQGDFIKVTDMQQIKKHDLLSTPGLVIDDKLVTGRPAPATTRICLV